MFDYGCRGTVMFTFCYNQLKDNLHINSCKKELQVTLTLTVRFSEYFILLYFLSESSLSTLLCINSVLTYGTPVIFLCDRTRCD